MKIITDTACDIMEEEARQLGVNLVPLNISFGEIPCNGNTPETFQRFYELLDSNVFPTTSQPAPSLYAELYEQARAAGEEALVIALSGGLSGTIGAAITAKEVTGYEKVWVLDSHQAIIPQRLMVEYAARLRDAGKTASEICVVLEEFSKRVEVCGIPGDLTYLKRGGRIPRAVATLGNLLNIKPLIHLKRSTLASPGKARGYRGGEKLMWKEMDRVELDPDWPVCFGYIREKAEVERFRDLTVKRYGLQETRLLPVGGTIGAHLGPGCVIVCFVAKKPIFESR